MDVSACVLWQEGRDQNWRKLEANHRAGIEPAPRDGITTLNERVFTALCHEAID